MMLFLISTFVAPAIRFHCAGWVSGASQPVGSLTAGCCRFIPPPTGRGTCHQTPVQKAWLWLGSLFSAHAPPCDAPAR